MFVRHGVHGLQVIPNLAASSRRPEIEGRTLKAAIEEQGQEEAQDGYIQPESGHFDTVHVRYVIKENFRIAFFQPTSIRGKARHPSAVGKMGQ